MKSPGIQGKLGQIFLLGKSKKKLAIIEAIINNLSCTEKNNVADSISNRLLHVR